MKISPHAVFKWSLPFTSLMFMNLAGAQVSLHFTDNFGGDAPGGGDPSFTTYASYPNITSPTNYWTISSTGIGGTGHGLESLINNNSSTIYSSAVVNAPLVGSFSSLSSEYQILSQPGSSIKSYIGLAAFGNTANVGQIGETGNNLTINSLWFYMQTSGASGNGSLGVVNFRNGANSSTGITIGSQVGVNLAVSTSDVYTLSLLGSYDAGGDLTLTYMAENDTLSTSASLTETISASVMSTYYYGDYFGIMDRDNSSGTGNAGAGEGTTVLQNDFGVAGVPEPSTAASMFLGLAALVSGRKLFAKKSNRSKKI